MRRSLFLFATALIPAAALATETITYTYDAKGRLMRAAHSGSVNNGVATDYQFDRADNRTRQTITGVPVAPPLPPVPTANVVDASFEQPAVGAGFQYNPNVSGAFFDGGAGVAGNGSPWSFATAPAGTQVGFLQSASGKAASIVLNVDGLVVGREYAVRFKMARRPGWNPDQVHVTLQDRSLGFYSPAATSFQQVTTATFTATSTVGALAFGGTVDPSNLTVALDDVSVVQAGTLFNPSFEQPGVGAGFQPNPGTADQFFAGSSGIAGNGSAWGFGNAPQGTQAAYIQNNGSGISMRVTGLTPGARYVVRFHMARRPSFYAPNTLHVTFASTSFGRYTPTSTTFTPVTTAAFTATSDTGVLNFTGETPDSGSGIDAISIAPAP